jgi:hypothetical protein
MKLVADWRARSRQLDRLLAAGCTHCGGPVVAGGTAYDPPLDWTLSARP